MGRKQTINKLEKAGLRKSQFSKKFIVSMLIKLLQNQINSKSKWINTSKNDK